MPFTLALIHTSAVLIPTFTALARKELREMKVFHMVDESLIQNTIASGGLTTKTIRRVIDTIGSAHQGGADAVLVTCSSIGQAIPIARQVFDFPILRIDEAMAVKATNLGSRIGVAATLKTTLEPTVGLLQEKAAQSGRKVDIVQNLCSGAFEKVLAGDTEAHDLIVSEALRTLMCEVEVVVLAQASMARVVDKLSSEELKIPILSSPELAIQQARELATH